MKKNLIFLFILAISSFALAQNRPEPDRIATSSGDVIVQPILHGTMVLTWNDQVIYVDPYGGAERFEGLEDPTLILITDIHGDHLNQKTLDVLNTKRASFIAPAAVVAKLPEMMKKKTTTVENGQTIIYEGMELLAMPMYNLPEEENSRHPKGRGNGYVLTIGDKRIYISGDTEGIPEMRSLSNIDVAFICMNLPYTMDVDQAADAVNDFKPKVVYPYHYRGKGGLSDLDAFAASVNAESPGVEVRLRNWYSEN